MFNPLPLLAAAALAAPSVQMAQAQTPQAGQQAQAPRQMSKADYTRNVDAQSAAIDTNKDGSLDKAELTAAVNASRQQRADAQFKQLDTNKDNQISMAEFKAAAPPVNVDPMIAQLDANKDGRVSAAEYRTPQLATFDRTDTNKDGVLTAAEVQAARANR